MTDQAEYKAGIVDLPEDVREAWRTVFRHYENLGEVLIACISVTVATEQPSVQFLRHDNIRTPADMLNALDALEYAIDRVRSGLFK